jgi:hypothetical protein
LLQQQTPQNNLPDARPVLPVGAQNGNGEPDSGDRASAQFAQLASFGIIAIITEITPAGKSASNAQIGDRAAKAGVILGWISIVLSVVFLCVGVVALSVYVFTCGGAPVC